MMDMRLKTCSSTKLQDVQKRSRRSSSSSTLLMDRLTALPPELLIRILSLLPTKDAAAACFSCKTMIRVFPWLTSLDLDDSPIAYCQKQPHAVERFPTFVAFVDSVLQPRPCPCPSNYLNRFRLGLGPHLTNPYRWSKEHSDELCELGCFPDLKSTKINSWISSSLACCGLRELDLRIGVREEGGAQLPPEIFTCETLEVLKLEVNLGLYQVSTMPSFHLPNLRLAVFSVAVIPDDRLLTRFLSGCPLLENLTVAARWKDAHFLSISSSSLQRLTLNVCNKLYEFHKSDFVLLHTPNLKYLDYTDNLASHYSITPMNCLVKANLSIDCILHEDDEASGLLLLSLLKPLSNVQHLALDHDFMEDLHHDGVVNQLPWFLNLKSLELRGADY